MDEFSCSYIPYGRLCHEAANRIAELEARMVDLPPKREPDEFVTDVDGFVYYWPDGGRNGHYASHHLRRIATELDDRNREWLAKMVAAQEKNK